MLFRLIRCEMKKLMKSKTTLLMLVLSFAVTFLLIFITISGHYSTRINSDGTIEKLKGVTAIKENQKKYEVISGVVDTASITESVYNYQMLIKKYDTIEHIPKDLYEKKINLFFPIDNFVLDTIKLTNKDSDLMSLNASNLTDFYGYRDQSLESFVKGNTSYGDNIKEKIMTMNKKVNTPFQYEYGLGTDDLFFKYLGMLIWILILLLAVIVVPIFSSDNENESIYIIKSTKYGNMKLALAKLIIGICIPTISFIICIGIFLIVTNGIFDFEGGKTSFQLLFGYSKSLFTGTSFDAQLFICLSGLITLWAVVSFTLLISTISKNSAIPMISMIIILFLPTFLSIIHNGSSWIDRLIYTLPSSSVGLKNSMDIMLGRFDFLPIMGYLIWIPYYTIIIGFIFNILFFMLIPHLYQRKEA